MAPCDSDWLDVATMRDNCRTCPADSRISLAVACSGFSSFQRRRSRMLTTITTTAVKPIASRSRRADVSVASRAVSDMPSVSVPS